MSSLLLLTISLFTAASDLKIELGQAAVSRNEFRIPSAGGTDMTIPDKNIFYYRMEGRWDWDENNGLRVVIAPFQYEETITSTGPIVFDKQTFSALTPTTLKFKFNSYRVGYVRHLVKNDTFTFDAGATLKMRDALIAVDQFGREEKFTDFGFVPLLYLAATYNWAENWSVFWNVDGAGSSQGYAVDTLLEMQYHSLPRDTFSVGLRFLDGGADNDKVKNFATVFYAHVGYYYRF